MWRLTAAAAVVAVSTTGCATTGKVGVPGSGPVGGGDTSGFSGPGARWTIDGHTAELHGAGVNRERGGITCSESASQIGKLSALDMHADNAFVILYDVPSHKVTEVTMMVQDGSQTYAIGFVAYDHPSPAQLTRSGDAFTVTGTATTMNDKQNNRLGGPVDFKLEMNCQGSW